MPHHSIEKRCGQHRTGAFVTAETVDPLADKLVGILGDRRMTVVHRYLGKAAGTLRVSPGLRLWRGGFDHNPIGRTPRQRVYVSLMSHAQRTQGFGFSVDRDDETEEDVRRRYNSPEDKWGWERRNLTSVVLTGWPGSPHHEDQIEIEYWNSHGVGQVWTVAFDDLDPLQEVGWLVKGDRERQVQLWDEFCDRHGLHFEHPDHQRSGCTGRQATLAENLAVLSYLAAHRDQSDDTTDERNEGEDT